MEKQRRYDLMIDDNTLCVCGRRYKDHFYYERGSTHWFWAWSIEANDRNKCEGFKKEVSNEI